MSTFTFQEDLADDFKWTTIETERDDNGQILSRTSVFDNGLINGQTFENGVLRHMVQQDTGQNGDGSDLKKWDSIERFFDQNGQKTAQVVQYDDGTVFGQNYENGVLRYSAQEDLDVNGGPSDVKSWEKIEKYYDQNGQITAQVTKFDNGVVQGQNYENGVLRYVSLEDITADGGPSDVKPWERIEKYFDASGQMTARVEQRDNGVSIVKEFEQGTLRVITQEDKGPDGVLSDVMAWDSITTYFDEGGKLSAKETIYDDGDVTSFLFENGARTLKLEFDGDESETWLVRETIYDENNKVFEVNTYDSYDEVPPEYGLFGVM